MRKDLDFPLVLKISIDVFVPNQNDRVHELPSGASDLLKLGLSSKHHSFQQSLSFFQVIISDEDIKGTIFLQFVPKEIVSEHY
jgi:hypothetical protein